MNNNDARLLAIDDDAQIGEVVGEIGAQAGFDVTVTTSADSFKESVRSLTPDVIVLDLQMPGTDGVQMLRFLAEAASRASVLLVSGMDERTIAAAEQYGISRRLRMLGTLQKPFAPDELLERLSFAKAVTQPLTGADLRRAIERNELSVYYQPTIQRFADGSWDIVSMEALV